MKTKRLLGLLLLILSITGFVACSDDEPQDKVETVKMLISDKTGTYQPWGSDSPIDCMLVKEESESDYKTLDFQGITDFVYEKGYEYALWVEKRTLVDPPADGSSIVYKLIDVISKAKVEYEYTIKVDGPNPFILSPEGGEYEIPFTCKAKKFAEGNLIEDGYILKYKIHPQLLMHPLIYSRCLTRYGAGTDQIRFRYVLNIILEFIQQMCL